MDISLVRECTADLLIRYGAAVGKPSNAALEPKLISNYPLPSAPPIDLMNQQGIIEYVMVEKNDLNFLLTRSDDINMKNKYYCFL